MSAVDRGPAPATRAVRAGLPVIRELRAAGVTWADGDFAALEAPASPDATLADITIGARS